MNRLTTTQRIYLMKKIEERGLIVKFNEHSSYFLRLYVKKIISREELLKSRDSTLTSLGGGVN